MVLKTLSNVSLRSTTHALTRPVLKLPPLSTKESPEFMQGRSRSTAFRAPRSRILYHPFPFRLSTSRVMDFLNILASNADAHHDDDQNLAAGLRFENAANISSCHSNQPCCRSVPRTTRFLSLPNSISCRMPQVSQASTALVQSATVLCFPS